MIPMTKRYEDLEQISLEKGLLLIVHLNVRSLVHKIEEIRYIGLQLTT